MFASCLARQLNICISSLDTRQLQNAAASLVYPGLRLPCTMPMESAGKQADILRNLCRCLS